MSKWHGGKGDKPRKSSVSQEQMDANWEAIFGKKDQKHKQPEFWEHYCTVEATKMGVAKGEECNWCGETE